MEAQRGARAEGINPEQAHLGTARFPVPPDPTDAPRPGHALPPWQPRGPLSPGTRAVQRDLAASFPCKTRLLSLCGKSAASGGVVFPFSHPRAAPGWPWAEFLGKRRSTRGSRPGRAPAPCAGSLAATRLDPGAPRSFLALLPSSTVINLPFPVEATLTQTGAGCKSRWPPRDARPAGHGGGFGNPGGAARLSLPGPHTSPRGFAEPRSPSPATGGSVAGCSEAREKRRWQQERVPGTRWPRSARALPSPPALPCPSCLGLKRAGETGPAPGDGTASPRPCPLREGIPLVSGTAACPFPHASQPAASTPRHRPFKIRSLFFLSPTLFSSLFFFLILGVFFLHFSPLS